MKCIIYSSNRCSACLKLNLTAILITIVQLFWGSASTDQYSSVHDTYFFAKKITLHSSYLHCFALVTTAAAAAAATTTTTKSTATPKSTSGSTISTSTTTGSPSFPTTTCSKANANHYCAAPCSKTYNHQSTELNICCCESIVVVFMECINEPGVELEI